MKHYDAKKVEKKWQKYWEEHGTYRQYKRPKKFYALDMFPYPSGAGLHMGHPKGYTATDIVSRMKQLQGYGVLHPMGWDAFGLPAEQYAIKNKVHPSVATRKNVATFKKQLEKLGFTYDWDREINTTDPEYYKWTQWIFLQLFKKGLAYQSWEPINWCPSCQTGLANEDLEDGKCERCGSVVEQKPLRQWVLKMTAYADRLLYDLDACPSGRREEKLDWSEAIKEQQRNWIGRSEGTTVKFRVIARSETTKQSPSDKEIVMSRKSGTRNDDVLEVFTTRVDTIFGCTYVVVAPEHPLVRNQESRIKNQAKIRKYLEDVKKKTEMDRLDATKEKTGVKLEGIEAANPFTGEAVPVFVADYVLGHYGTGAVMAVPAHDERDFAFAKKYDLPIKESIAQLLIPNEDQIRMLENYQKGAKRYFYRGTSAPEDTKEWLSAIREKLDSSAKIIEVGSANGWVADFYAPFGMKVECTDAVDAFVEHMKKVGRTSRKLDLFKDTFLRETYDCIIAVSVLHHFTQEQFVAILGKMHRGLKENGILAFRLKKGEGARFVPSNEGISAFYTFWQEDDLRQTLEQNGYSVESLKANESDSHISVIARKKEMDDIVFVEDGILVNSGEFSGLMSAEAREKMAAWLSKNQMGGKKVNYKMRDWTFSRQRYWGEPIPLVHCEKCGVVPVPEKDLPVLLPNVKSYEPTGTGESPLAAIAKWVNTKCPKCGGKAKRETNTMPQWAGSCWYYLRYIDPKNNKKLVDLKKEKDWMPVDLYVGGAEHATRHLLYARFWHKFLYDLKAVSTKEPFKRLVHVGLLLAEDGRKMSKRWGNVVNPDDMVAQFGADAVRLYLMFMGPFSQSVAWNTDGVVGTRRFLEKVWKLQEKVSEMPPTPQSPRRGGATAPLRQGSRPIQTLLHKTIKKVTEDIEEFRFNTAISSLMILTNEMEKQEFILATDYMLLATLLSPFAPHIAEELWESLGHKKSIFIEAEWPKANPKYLKEETVEIVVQVNGKLRSRLSAPAGADEATVRALAEGDANVIAHLTGKTIRKVILVPNRLINFVVG